MGADPLPGDSDGEADPAPGTHLTSISLDPELGASARARRFVADRLAGATSETALYDVTLVASELVTNALLHGSGRVELSLRPDGARVRVEVCDQGCDAVVEMRPLRPGMTSGWGLQIIDQLAERWGTSEGPTRVWAELSLI